MVGWSRLFSDVVARATTAFLGTTPTPDAIRTQSVDRSETEDRHGIGTVYYRRRGSSLPPLDSVDSVIRGPSQEFDICINDNGQDHGQSRGRSGGRGSGGRGAGERGGSETTSRGNNRSQGSRGERPWRVSQVSPTPPVSHSISPAPQRPKRHEKRRKSGTDGGRDRTSSSGPQSKPEAPQPMVDEEGFTLVNRKGKQRAQPQKQATHIKNGNSSSKEPDIYNEVFPELLGTFTSVTLKSNYKEKDPLSEGKQSEATKQDDRPENNAESSKISNDNLLTDSVQVACEDVTVPHCEPSDKPRKDSQQLVNVSSGEKNSQDKNKQNDNVSPKTWDSYMQLIEAAEEEVGVKEEKKRRKEKSKKEYSICDVVSLSDDHISYSDFQSTQTIDDVEVSTNPKNFIDRRIKKQKLNSEQSSFESFETSDLLDYSEIERLFPPLDRPQPLGAEATEITDNVSQLSHGTVILGLMAGVSKEASDIRKPHEVIKDTESQSKKRKKKKKRLKEEPESSQNDSCDNELDELCKYIETKDKIQGNKEDSQSFLETINCDKKNNELGPESDKQAYTKVISEHFEDSFNSANSSRANDQVNKKLDVENEIEKQVKENCSNNDSSVIVCLISQNASRDNDQECKKLNLENETDINVSVNRDIADSPKLESNNSHNINIVNENENEKLNLENETGMNINESGSDSDSPMVDRFNSHNDSRVNEQENDKLNLESETGIDINESSSDSDSPMVDHFNSHNDSRVNKQENEKISLENETEININESSSDSDSPNETEIQVNENLYNTDSPILHFTSSISERIKEFNANSSQGESLECINENNSHDVTWKTNDKEKDISVDSNEHLSEEEVSWEIVSAQEIANPLNDLRKHEIERMKKDFGKHSDEDFDMLENELHSVEIEENKLISTEKSTISTMVAENKVSTGDTFLQNKQKELNDKHQETKDGSQIVTLDGAERKDEDIIELAKNNEKCTSVDLNDTYENPIKEGEKDYLKSVPDEDPIEKEIREAREKRKLKRMKENEMTEKDKIDKEQIRLTIEKVKQEREENRKQRFEEIKKETDQFWQVRENIHKKYATENKSNILSTAKTEKNKNISETNLNEKCSNNEGKSNNQMEEELIKDEELRNIISEDEDNNKEKQINEMERKNYVENESKEKVNINTIDYKTQNICNEVNKEKYKDETITVLIPDVEKCGGEKNFENQSFKNYATVSHLDKSKKYNYNENIDSDSKVEESKDNFEISKSCENCLRKTNSAPLQINKPENKNGSVLIKKSESNDTNANAEIKQVSSEHKLNKNILNERKHIKENKNETEKDKKKRKKSKEEKEKEHNIKEQEKKLRISALIRAAEEAEKERKRKYKEKSSEREKQLIEEIEALDKKIMEKEVQENVVEDEGEVQFDEELDAREKQLMDEIETFDKVIEERERIEKEQEDNREIKEKELKLISELKILDKAVNEAEVICKLNQIMECIETNKSHDNNIKSCKGNSQENVDRLDSHQIQNISEIGCEKENIQIELTEKHNEDIPEVAKSEHEIGYCNKKILGQLSHSNLLDENKISKQSDSEQQELSFWDTIKDKPDDKNSETTSKQQELGFWDTIMDKPDDKNSETTSDQQELSFWDTIKDKPDDKNSETTSEQQDDNTSNKEVQKKGLEGNIIDIKDINDIGMKEEENNKDKNINNIDIKKIEVSGKYKIENKDNVNKVDNSQEKVKECDEKEKEEIGKKRGVNMRRKRGEALIDDVKKEDKGKNPWGVMLKNHTRVVKFSNVIATDTKTEDNKEPELLVKTKVIQQKWQDKEELVKIDKNIQLRAKQKREQEIQAEKDKIFEEIMERRKRIKQLKNSCKSIDLEETENKESTVKDNSVKRKRRPRSNDCSSQTDTTKEPLNDNKEKKKKKLHGNTENTSEENSDLQKEVIHLHGDSENEEAVKSVPSGLFPAETPGDGVDFKDDSENDGGDEGTENSLSKRPKKRQTRARLDSLHLEIEDKAKENDDE
ncbi:unnamed protein product, partial [Meganyctiphanes norvegica]